MNWLMVLVKIFSVPQMHRRLLKEIYSKRYDCLTAADCSLEAEPVSLYTVNACHYECNIRIERPSRSSKKQITVFRAHS